LQKYPYAFLTTAKCEPFGTSKTPSGDLVCWGYCSFAYRPGRLPKTRNYWKYLKAKLKKENSQVVSATTQLKFLAPDGKKRLADMLDYTGIIA